MHYNNLSSSCHKKTTTSLRSQPQLKQYFPKAQQTLITKSIFSACQVLSIIQKSFICIHYKGEIFLIDQHAACQKLLYIQKSNQLKSHNRPSKRVTNKHYSIPNMFCSVLVQKKGLIESLGWEFCIVQRLGTFTVINVVKQPFVLTETIGEDQLLYYLEMLYADDVSEIQEIQDTQERQKITIKQQSQPHPHHHQYTQHIPQLLPKNIDLSQRQKQLIAQYSCRHSYKFGQQLSIKKAQSIIRKLGEIQAPFNCPHSRLLISYYGKVSQLGF